MRLFHGGVPGLRIGDLIEPGQPHFVDGCPVCVAKASGFGTIYDPLTKHPDRVYLTSDREYARSMPPSGRTATWAQHIPNFVVSRLTSALSAATEHSVGNPSLIITSNLARWRDRRAV